MSEQYRIRLKAHFSATLASYFEGFSPQQVENGETILTGKVADQAALHGLLALIRDLGIPLLEVKQIQPGASLLEKPVVKLLRHHNKSNCPNSI
ncbi:MAG TPA: hypothetical protein VH186_33760 [Chloroflexia bacterium]|nr:hypothetical protein [Chloroflexia bacterium]